MNDSTFQMPAEWFRHSATQLHWPSNRNTWPGERLERVEEVYSRIIEELHFYEPIHLFVESLKVRNRVMQKLSGRAVDLDRIIIHQHKINDVWARDCGPIFVQDESGSFSVTDWDYNVRREEYSSRKDDNAIPAFIAQKFGVNRMEPDMALEGGFIDVNGAGALISTESALLTGNRNPDLTKGEIEERLRTFLGVDQIIWLKGGLAEGGNGGRIDNITRWLSDDTVLAMVCENKEDVNYDILQENLEILKQAKLKNGKRLNIETLPLHQTKINDNTGDNSKYAPASYANFYIANGAVLLPLFGTERDGQAIQLLRKYFPGRKVIGIECGDLVTGRGSIHSITQQWYGIN